MTNPTGEEILQYLLEAGEASQAKVQWGKSGYRNVVIFQGKKYQYKGSGKINKRLLKSILPLYISMPPKVQNKNTKNSTNSSTKKDDDDKKATAANKIIGAFHKRMKLKVDKIDKSMKDKVKAIKIIPTAIGKNQYGNIEALIENSYKVARRQMPYGKKFQVYTFLKFASQKGGDDFEVRSTKFTNKAYKEMLVQVVDRAMELLQSDHEVLLKDFQITFNFVEIPDGGTSSVSREKLSILNKTSVNRVINDDNNCFWYALVMLVYAKHPQIKQIKMGRKIRTTLAMELCEKVGLEWNQPVSFDEIATVEKHINCNIMILDIESIPILNTTSNIYNTLMYKNSHVKSCHQYWLLHDTNHYHAINNIKGFLAVDYFCHQCLHGFHHKKAYDEHVCQECEDDTLNCKKKKQVKSSKIGKELSHYLHYQDMKGGQQEVDRKVKKFLEDNKEESFTSKDIENLKQMYASSIEHPNYIIYDFEADVASLTHKPNHVEADVLTIGDTHNYNECKHKEFSYSGYDVVDKFCDWLFTSEHAQSTVIAHNQAGYDGRFILQWCLKRGLHPSKFIRQGSRIMYMEFKKFHIRFVDSLHFFLEPLKSLSSTYNIDTLKGFFPHFFNTPEHQDYVGKVPCESMYGVRNMDSDTYNKEFKPWYKKLVSGNNNDWNFKEEMKKYCRADVELLSKAVLRFRQMFKEKLDIDPFRYVTLASLCMAIFRGCFLPEKSIVSNDQNKPISKVCKEWLLHLNDDKLVPEVPIKIERDKIVCNECDLHSDKLEDDTKVYYPYNKHMFTVDAIDRKRKLIKEFNGCFFHGCPKCHPECKAKYNKTMERKNLLEMAGYKVEFMWECEWNNIKNDLPNKQELEAKARKQHIRIRDALCGGRTEAFKSYIKCNKHQKIFYLDVCSLYPTVNALDDYAVGFKQYVDITVDDILSNDFIGLVKCDIVPPKDLHVPVLPDNSEGKLLFHLIPMYEKTWSSVELKLALEKGYTITKIHAAIKYKRYNGLMKEYVGCFLKMKLENSGVKTQEECDKVNEYHKRLGFKFEIKPEDTVKNPGLRQVAKICLNSLWGKFGQRCGMDDYDFFYDYNSMIKHFINNDKIIPQTWNIINNECVELRYTEDTDMVIESDYISEITAVFTTANARVRLYKMMDWLDPSQIAYCDTDSVIFLYDETNENHKNPYVHEAPDGLEFGSGLGQWEDEFDGKDYIEELVIGGAKSYSYKTAFGCTKKGKVSVKQKGITLDRANDKVVNFETMKRMVLNTKTFYDYDDEGRQAWMNEMKERGTNDLELESKPRHQFKWETRTKDIITKNIKRSIKSTIKEKRTIDGYGTLPFGFIEQ